MRTSARVLLLLLLAVLALGACSSDDDTGDGTDSAATASSTTTAAARPDADQTPPASVNGIKVDGDGALWIASIDSNEVLAVDAGTGEILQRVAAPEGAGPDDVAIADDGTVYWTGFLGGQVGRIDPATGETTTIAEVGVGANPIAVRADGSLIVGRAVTATGLFTVDPAGDDGVDAQALADPGSVNSFSFSPDGVLYAPLTGETGSSVVAIDADTGEVTETVVDVTGLPVAVRWHDGALYVLVIEGGATVYRVTIDDGAIEPFAETGLTVADNLALDDDGTVYVTGFDEPTVTVIDPSGAVTGTLDIGS